MHNTNDSKLIYEAYASETERLAKLREWANELSPCGWIFFSYVDNYHAIENYDFYDINGFLDHINYPDMTLDEIFELYGEPFKGENGVNAVGIDENVWVGFDSKEIMKDYFKQIFETGEYEDIYTGDEFEINVNELRKVLPPHLYVNNTEYNISDEEIDELFS